MSSASRDAGPPQDGEAGAHGRELRGGRDATVRVLGVASNPKAGVGLAPAALAAVHPLGVLLSLTHLSDF